MSFCSGVSAGGSQETDLASPQVPGTKTPASVQFCTLVRKLSEVEGIDPQHILRSDNMKSLKRSSEILLLSMV